MENAKNSNARIKNKGKEELWFTKKKLEKVGCKNSDI